MKCGDGYCDLSQFCDKKNCPGRDNQKMECGHRVALEKYIKTAQAMAKLDTEIHRQQMS